MKRTIGIILAGAALCLAANAYAQVSPPAPQGQEYVIHDDVAPIQKELTHPKKKRVKKRHTKKTSYSSARAHIRAAQGFLERLGYEPGPDDGILGPKTRAAIKKFQPDHDLRATGTLNDATFRALSKETGTKAEAGELAVPAPRPDFIATHPDFYGYYGDQGSNPNTLAPSQPIPSRFGTVEIGQEQTGSTYRYTVTLNSQPVFTIDNQPSFVNVSRTFNLDDADAIIFTSYENGNATCPYRHHLLIARSAGSGVREIANCSREYEAYTENGMLLISFPESHVDGWSSGDSWRYDHGTLEKL